MEITFIDGTKIITDNFANISFVNIKKLYCGNFNLTKLPDLPNCENLDCHNNKLTSLPNLPNVKFLDCANNKLTSLPDLPKCSYLICYNNYLTVLPEVPCAIAVDYYKSNNMAYDPDSIKNINIVARVRKFWISYRFYHKWRVIIRKRKCKIRSYDVIKLFYCPDYNFYKLTEEYNHFKTLQNREI